MTEHIKPFVRVNDQKQESPDFNQVGGVPWWVQLMCTHYRLVAGMFFVGMLTLAGSLYGEFDNVTITGQLGLSFVRDIYEAKTQEKLLLLIILGAVSLLFLHASSRISGRQRGVLLWSRAAALVLLAGVPAGIIIWRAADEIAEVDSIWAEALADFPWTLRIASAILIGQAALALWYQVGLSLPSVRAKLSSQARSGSAIGQLTRLAVVLWLAGLLFAGGALGVLSHWLYEIPVADAEPGGVLYSTSFDGYADDWDTFQGRDEAQIRSVERLGLLPDNANYPAVFGNALVMTHGAPLPGGIVWSTLDRVFRDFDLRVTMQQVSGPYDQNQYGVLFRYHDERNFYVFRITSDGWYKLAKVSDGNEEIISDWGETTAIHASMPSPNSTEALNNRANEIRVVAQGDEFHFWVNGVALPLCLRGTNTMSMWSGPGTCLTAETIPSFSDSDHDQGQIALVVGSLDGSSVTVAFDDLVITGPGIDVTQP